MWEKYVVEKIVNEKYIMNNSAGQWSDIWLILNLGKLYIYLYVYHSLTQGLMFNNKNN